ncbi:ParB/RepB/Spo0J family partition protein [uncultured Dysosmobacter sp.]|uniref:ParB/RepB/Spo0J family partition protein n=1 Tax=uncultured Dysosmobacter sp. TaxID=2591384 RepID=UPI0026202C09|nr:ParB/RepB/Spo0J family partition protein [uncultured Dysosmobacter sp.]
MSKFDMGEFARTLRRTDVPDSGTGLREQIEYIDIGLLGADPKNFYSLSGVSELADNIQMCGLQQPIRVRETGGGRYVIVSGHRRRAALQRLVEEGFALYSQVPCIVERDEVSPAMQELRLIMANSDSRKLTPADLSRQMDRVEDLLRQLQAEGYEFPGRMRPYVAQLCKISDTKASNLSAIKNGLKVPGLIQKWECGEISEAAALEISRMDMDTQYRLLDWMRVPGRSYSIKEVRKFRTIWTCAERKCPETAGLCENAEEMYRVCYHAGTWNCAGCCKRCLRRGTCEAVCRYAPPLKIEEDAPQRPSTAYEAPESDTAPAGQLCISGWLPCGTNPGPEPGLCAALMDLGKPDLHAKVLWWDGAKWLFKKNGPEAGLLPVWWMRLPEPPAKGEKSC